MLPPLLERVASLGHKTFANGDWDMNIIAIRSKGRKAGKFDDRIFLVFKVQDQWRQHMWACTTDPGTYYLKTASKEWHDKGTAIAAAGQYPASHSIGSHKGYTALVQTGKMKCFRDKNMDEILDMDPDTLEEGRFSLNIHRSSATKISKANIKWSGGCCVFANPAGFVEFMRLCHKQVRQRGWKTFTYTLIED
jgi:hypothetical protein|tara:strand:- start:1405 stop:1983 length:579 start_codon:yes stop_codon:yes gene_type:complete